MNFRHIFAKDNLIVMLFSQTMIYYGLGFEGSERRACTLKQRSLRKEFIAHTFISYIFFQLEKKYDKSKY